MSGPINEYAYAFYQSYSRGRRLGRNAGRVARNNSPVALGCTNLRVGQGYEFGGHVSREAGLSETERQKNFG